jgi:uncharacterized Zn-finger protein
MEKKMINQNITIITDLNKAIYCPTSKQKKDNSHPKVFLKINENTKMAICPYCSHTFKIKD